VMQEIYTNVTKVMVDQRSSAGSLLYLPLDKLIQQVTPGSPSALVPSSNTVTNTPAVTTAPAASPTSNSTNPPAANTGDRRDSLRSRER
jgi:membrane protease subunit HflK